MFIAKKNKGTTFKIYFPQSGEYKQELAEKETISESLHGSETLLIVEDDQIVRTLISQTLSQYGYTTLTASSPLEALKIHQKKNQIIHLFIVDVILPQMRGVDLVCAIQQERPDVKVLYISGYTEDTIVHHGIIEKGVHFLNKPFSPDALLQKVRRILDQE